MSKTIKVGKKVEIWEDVVSEILTHGISTIDYINREDIWLNCGNWSIIIHNDGTWERR